MNWARTRLPSQTSDCCTASFPSLPPSSLPASLSSRAWSLAPGLARSTSDVSEQPWSLPRHITCCCTLSSTHKHNLHSCPLNSLVPACNKPVKQRA